LTRKLSQHEIVTLALFHLGGETRFVDTEDIAVKAHDLAPGQFTWRKYPEQINLEIVRVCLSNAKKPENGTFVSGSGTKGWTLTPDGLRWAKTCNDDLFAGVAEAPTGKRRAGSVDTARRSRELNRINSCEAWRKWQGKSDDITVTDAKQVFRIDSYSKGDMLLLKIDRTRKMFIDDDAISNFLQEMRDIIFTGEQQ